MQLKWPMLWDLFSLFPAHAGVIPGSCPAGFYWQTFPRTRGGDPITDYPENIHELFSPHTRG